MTPDEKVEIFWVIVVMTWLLILQLQVSRIIYNEKIISNAVIELVKIENSRIN